MASTSVQAGTGFAAAASSSKHRAAAGPTTPRGGWQAGNSADASTHASPRDSAAGRVAALVAGNLLAVAAVFIFSSPEARLVADPELARLLRGMALIKGAILLPVLALLVWRLRSPITARLAIAYLLAACAMCAATALIWQLSAIAPAALLFHLGALTLMLLAWRDDMPRARLSLLARPRTRDSHRSHTPV